MMIDFISATSADPADDMLPYAAFYLGLHRCLPKYLLIKINFQKKNLFECQAVLIQIRPGILLGLIWLQTVCKGYQQMTKNAPRKERVNTGYMLVNRDSRLNQVNMQASTFIRECDETVL